MAAVTVRGDCGDQERKSVAVSTFSPSICHEVMGLNAIVLDFWMLSFKPAFSFSSFTLIKRFFSSSSLSPIRLVSSAYMRLLIFLLAILIPVCESSSLAFLMMYFAYQLNKVRVYNLEYFSYSFSLPGLVEFQPRHTHTAYYFQL